jgi:hypothetical protein
LVESPLAAARADATAGDSAWAEACADARALADALAETVRPSGAVTLVELFVLVAVVELVETLVPVPLLVTDVLVLLALLDELPETALLEEEGPVRCAVLTPTRIRPGSTLTPTSDVESVNESRIPPSCAFRATLGSGTGTADHLIVSAAP